MSQFRIKNIDGGVPDDWDFRINDDGLILGDDVVAEDPNELAQAITDTQDLILHATTYAPSQLIDPAHGALERIKIIEDNVGTTTLQDAYENGRFITVQPGRNLVIGSSGEIELDSSGNLKFNPNTMKVYSGSLEMDIFYAGVTSSSTDLTFGTISPTKDCFLRGGRNLYFRDSNLIANIPVSETGTTGLITSSNSIVGAINEISSGFSSANLQQIYDQSSPSEIQTSFTNGAVRITNNTGNSATPALVINGNEEVEKLYAQEISVSPSSATSNLLMTSDGNLATIGILETSSKVISPKIENTTGEIIFEDSRGIITLSEISDPGINTTKQTLFGAINELKSVGDSNSSVSAAMNVEHDTSTGKHKIINTQASAGTNSTPRLNIINDIGSTVITANAEGEIVCSNITTTSFDVESELTTNETHRTGDGTDHSAFATHIAAANPHGTVATISKNGATQLTGDVTLSPGIGVTITQTGNDIEIAAPVSSTLQGVYDSQATGSLILDTATNKDLFFKDSSSINILSMNDSEVTIYKDLTFIGTQTISTATGNLEIDTPSPANKVIIEGIDFTDGTTMSLDSSVPSNVTGAINELASDRYTEVVNGTGYTILKGTAVCVRDDGQLWIPYPNIDPANAFNSNWGEPSLMWHVTGIADQTIANGASGRIKIDGEITASITGVQPFYVGDSLYVANVGHSNLKILDSLLLDEGIDTITIDTGGATKVLKPIRTGGADPTIGEFDVSTLIDSNNANDETRDNIFDTLDNKTWMASGTPFYMAPFIAGERARGRIDLVAVGTPGDTLTITPNSIFGGNAVTLTGVATGTTPTHLQYEIGNTRTETAIYLAEAINRTSRDNGASGEGHLIEAQAYGEVVLVYFYQPAASGNNTVLSQTGTSFTLTNPSGGTAEINIYMSRRASTGTSHLCSSSDVAAATITNFSADESDKPFLTRREMADPKRAKTPFDKMLKVGKITNIAGPDVTFKIDIAEPEYYTRSYRGSINDIKY